MRFFSRGRTQWVLNPSLQMHSGVEVFEGEQIGGDAMPEMAPGVSAILKVESRHDPAEAAPDAAS